MEKVDFIKEIYFFFEQYLILSLNLWVCVRARACGKENSENSERRERECFVSFEEFKLKKTSLYSTNIIDQKKKCITDFARVSSLYSVGPLNREFA